MTDRTGDIGYTFGPKGLFRAARSSLYSPNRSSGLAKIIQAPEPDIPAIEVLEISPPDPNPPPDFSVRWHQEIFTRREARFKAMYGN